MSNINQQEPPVLGSADAPISRVDPKTSMTGWSTENAGQQASTMPGDGQAEPSAEEKLPFKEQVKGYAKKFAGQTFHNEKEKELGEAKLRGELEGPAAGSNVAASSRPQ